VNKKKILVDITTLSDQYYGRGIGIYTFELTKLLFKDTNFDWHAIGFEDMRKDPILKNVSFHSLGQVKLSNPFNPIRFRFKYMPIIRKVRPDLYFAPLFERGLPVRKVTTAVAMHDVIPLVTNKFSSKGKVINTLKGMFYKYNIRRAREADAIVANSHFTKTELIKVGFSENHIHVVHLGLRSDLSFAKVSKSSLEELFGITKPYIYYFGGFEPNKNIDLLLKAFSHVRSKMDIELVLGDRALYRKKGEVVIENELGRKYWTMIKQLGLEKSVILPGFLDGKNISLLMSNAKAFVHLSGYEGFGLTVLEALALGCPAVVADRSCYPEVVGNAAILVDPDDAKSVAREILNILTNENYAKTLSQRGKQHAKKYSWDNTCKETISVFKKLLI